MYWIPIFELLDTRGFAVFVVNARDAKHVPGRKTDVSDAQWLQRLHSYGLLSTSFRPKGRIAELRSYVRQRERLLEYAASHIQHMQKALMEMNLQVHHVVADITGSSRDADSRPCGSWPANVDSAVFGGAAQFATDGFAVGQCGPVAVWGIGLSLWGGRASGVLLPFSRKDIQNVTVVYVDYRRHEAGGFIAGNASHLHRRRGGNRLCI